MPKQTDFWSDTFGICPDLYIWTIVGLSKKHVSASKKQLFGHGTCEEKTAANWPFPRKLLIYTEYPIF